MYWFQNILMFGEGVESLLIKYGRGIVDEQFLLNRIASAAIDTYTMAVVLSRATRSLSQGLPSSQHELLMTQAWCTEVSTNKIVVFKIITITLHNG